MLWSMVSLINDERVTSVGTNEVVPMLVTPHRCYLQEPPFARHCHHTHTSLVSAQTTFYRAGTSEI